MAGEVWREMCGGRCMAGVGAAGTFLSGRKFIFGSIFAKNVWIEKFKFRICNLGLAPLRDCLILGPGIFPSGRKFGNATATTTKTKKKENKKTETKKKNRKGKKKDKQGCGTRRT